PPDWKIAVFDADTHQYCVQDSYAYGHQKITNALNWMYDPHKEKPVSTGKHETVAGLPTTIYESFGLSADAGIKGHPNSKTQIQYWVAEKLGLPQKLCDAYANASGLPVVPGLILRLKYKSKGSAALNTIAAEKKKMPDNFFQYPSGFKE